MAEFIGRRVKLCLNDGKEYEGFVHNVDTSTGKLTLEKVFVCGTGKKIPGLRSYFGNEIKGVEVQEEVKVKKKDDETIIPDKRERGPRLMQPKQIPPHIARLQSRAFQPKSHLLRNSSSEEESNEKKAVNMRNDKSSDYDSIGGTGSSDLDDSDTDADEPYILINKINQKFDEAMKNIKKESVIGLAMEGVCLGRKGKLCWLQIGTRDGIFLFDVISMQKSCFEHGLADILEDEDILKVMHDCRLPSDLLYHQYNISLCNVFDTQVADAFVYRLHVGKGDWPRYVSSLHTSLYDHLSLSEKQIYTFTVRQKHKKEDQEIWAQRPQSKNLLELAMKDVMYLRELRIVLMEKMLAEYVAGVDVYLTQVRGASADDAKKYQEKCHLLPNVFVELPALMTHKNHYRWEKRNREVQRDHLGFQENCHRNSLLNNVVYSNDSIWHTNIDMPKKQKKSEDPTKQKDNKEISTADKQADRSNETKTKPKLNLSEKPRSSTPIELNLNLNKRNDSETENQPVGSLIRKLINQTSDSDNDAHSEDDFLFKPAGEMQAQGIDARKRRKQQRNYESVIVSSENDIVCSNSIPESSVDQNQLVSHSELRPTVYSEYSSNGMKQLPVNHRNQSHCTNSEISMVKDENNEPLPEYFASNVSDDQSESPISRLHRLTSDKSSISNNNAAGTYSPVHNSHNTQFSNVDLNTALKNTTNRMEKLNLLREALNKHK